MRLLLLMLMGCGWLLACSRVPEKPKLKAPAAALSVTERAQLRDEARLVLERHCGQCHIGAYPTAMPRALRVYNLSAPEWAAGMSEDHLRKLDGRISTGALFDEFDVHNRGSKPPPPPTAEEQAIVRRYLHAELAARHPVPQAAQPCS